MGSSSEPDGEWVRKQVEKFAPCGWVGREALKVVIAELRDIGLDRLVPHFDTLVADPDPQIR